MPYAIVNIATGEIVNRFRTLPKALEVSVDGRKRRIVAPVAVGDEGLGFRFVDLIEVGYDVPGAYYNIGGTQDSFDGDHTITSTRTWVPWDQTKIDAFESDRKDRIASFVNDNDDPVRAALLVLIDEFNRHSAVHRAILAAASAATSLADFKTRMGQIAGIPARSPADLLNAVRGKIGTA